MYDFLYNSILDAKLSITRWFHEVVAKDIYKDVMKDLKTAMS